MALKPTYVSYLSGCYEKHIGTWYEKGVDLPVYSAIFLCGRPIIIK